MILAQGCEEFCPVLLGGIRIAMAKLKGQRVRKADSEGPRRRRLVYSPRTKVSSYDGRFVHLIVFALIVY